MIATSTVSATAIIGHPIQSVIGTSHHKYIEDTTGFPSDIPFGISSLTAVIGLYEYSHWTSDIYCVGFKIKVMRSRDGDPHSWQLRNGHVTITGTQPESFDLDNTVQTWSGTNPPHNWDIVTMLSYVKTTFDTMIVTGDIYADGQYTRTIFRIFFGSEHNFILSSNTEEHNIGEHDYIYLSNDEQPKINLLPSENDMNQLIKSDTSSVSNK